MQVTGEKRYAIAVREEGCLFLFMWVRRSKKSEFFVMLPRPQDKRIDAHASYHAGGEYHIKTHEKRGLPKIMMQHRQKLDRDFVGTENLLAQNITPWHPRDIGVTCDPNKYSEVFEIPVAELREGKVLTRVSADLVSPGRSPILMPDIRVIRQREYQDAFPFIVFTLYEVDW